MNATQRLLYRHVPSFRREHGGLYHLYTAVYSRAYAARMRALHRRGRHGRSMGGLDTRCPWCGSVTG